MYRHTYACTIVICFFSIRLCPSPALGSGTSWPTSSLPSPAKEGAAIFGLQCSKFGFVSNPNQWQVHKEHSDKIVWEIGDLNIETNAGPLVSGNVFSQLNKWDYNSYSTANPNSSCPLGIKVAKQSRNMFCKWKVIQCQHRATKPCSLCRHCPHGSVGVEGISGSKCMHLKQCKNPSGFLGFWVLASTCDFQVPTSSSQASRGRKFQIWNAYSL